MARMPRLLVPGYPHHVTQWGNRRMKTFFNAGDYQAYLDLVAKVKGDTGVEVWARLWTLPQDWERSSARAHLRGHDNEVVAKKHKAHPY